MTTTVEVPHDDIPLVEALIRVQYIADDDPEYLLARHIVRGTTPPTVLVAMAKAKMLEGSQDKSRMGVYRMIARNAAIMRKIEEHSNNG